jgi:uncharacterized membrane protein (DUF106 family)
MFDPLFDPLLQLGAFGAIILVSFILSVLITTIYKLMTNQKEMKEMKDKTKAYQKEIKKHQNDPKKMMSIQKDMMSLQGKYMMKSMKPTLVTFLPIMIIFGWLAANLAYVPITPGSDFSLEVKFNDYSAETIMLNVPEGFEILNGANQTMTDNMAVWNIKAGDVGVYKLGFDYRGASYTQDIKVSDGSLGEYEVVEQKVGKNNIKSIKTDLPSVKPLGNFSIFGWRPNWFWSYVIFSMIFSLSIRKIFKIH